KNSYKYFPKGTIHIIGIDADSTPDKKPLIVFLDGHYFICADNGIISLIATQIRPDKIFEITINDRLEPHFNVLGIFCKAACHLARGGKPELIGVEFKNLRMNKNVAPSVDEKGAIIYGHILYVDNYDNVVTNVSRTFFEKIAKGRKFGISIKGNNFDKIYANYTDFLNRDDSVADGKKFALWNASGNLEIAIYRSDKINVGGAQTLLGIKVQDTVTIVFQ